ncbi:MAG: VCBS repeat-containing protein [Planctomycetota bacterium]|nr:VCBS repeat-containing protein [Planctomycetota bacterium]
MDFDLDGDQDLFVHRDSTFEPLAWVENDGTGSFTEIHELEALPVNPTLARYVDVTEDGCPDLVLGAKDSGGTPGRVLLFEGLGGGEFADSQVLGESNGFEPAWIELADVNGDGDVDLLTSWQTGTQQGSSVTWSEGLGAGQFLPTLNPIIPLSVGPAHTYTKVQAVDLNGDGDLDLVITDRATNQMIQVNNLGAGVFSPGFVFLTLPLVLDEIPSDLDDYDNDGDVDLVIGNGTKFQIYDNDGTGQFAPPHLAPIFDEASALDLADLDGDGDLDLLYGAQAFSPFSKDTAGWIETLGPGSFAPYQLLDNGHQGIKTVEAADFDGDGSMDVLLASHFDGLVRTHESGGAGAFSLASQVWGEPENVNTLAHGDIDQDGYPEVLLGSWSIGPLHLFHNQGDGAYSTSRALSEVPNQVNSIAVADLNGDSIQDIVCAGLVSGEISWYEGLASGDFGPHQSLFTKPSTTASVVLTDDVDGDGDEDIYFGLAEGNDLQWIENLGGGSFAPAVRVRKTADPVTGLTLADLDGDGDRDLIIAVNGQSTGSVQRCDNLGVGQFSQLTSLWSGLANDVIATVSDVDVDGDLDVLLAVGASKEVRWCQNLGGGSLAPAFVTFTVSGTESPREIALAPINNDALPDLVLRIGSTVQVFHGHGNGSFNSAPMASIQGASKSMLVNDHDLDGKADITFLSQSGDVLVSRNISFLDCNQNGVHDPVDLSSGTSSDCNGNGVPDECDLLAPFADVDGDGLLDECFPPALEASRYEVSLAWGGLQQFTLRAPTANEGYLLLGSLSGESPGQPLGSLVLPLNPDAYFLFTLTHPNSYPLGSTFGVLSPAAVGGEATASVDVATASFPTLVGLTAHHAFVAFDVLSGQVNFVSNTVPLVFQP